jgi:CRISPR-associated endonuclease Csn1
MDTRNVLGLDLGTNSVGWALIEHAVLIGGASRPVSLIDAGVRIFQAGVEPNKNESRNVERRKARAMRRQHDRRNRRRAALRNCLARAGLLPPDAGGCAALFAANDPYALRAKGLDQPLAPDEIGRALFHLGQRRGFLSNRRTDRGARKKENQGIAAEISQLQRDIDSSGARTLGGFFARIDRSQQRIRGRHTSRAMYENEFEALWTAQQRFHPNLMTPELRRDLHSIIFHQRPLKLQKDLVGECEFERHRKRSPRATWYAQQFRLLQDVNHLEFADSVTGEVQKLSADQRAKLMGALARRKEMTFDSIRRLLGMLDSQKFNFESGERRSKLKGNFTEAALRAAFKEQYNALAIPVRDSIVHDLLFVDDSEVIRRHAIQRYGISPGAAEALCKIELPGGYLHLSERALKRLLPHLERGLGYTEAVSEAGYQRRDQRMINARDVLQREDMPELRNPIVTASLGQMRLVVNAIVRAYGKPHKIRVEMARDLKVSLAKRAELSRDQARRERENEAVRGILEREYENSNPARADVERYRLWKQQSCACPYTGRTIPSASLFGPEWEVDHILPLPRSGEDSFANKVLCATEANRDKGDRIPWEAWGGDPARWGEIAKRAEKLPWPTRRRFLIKEIPGGFIDRQLNDTRYIAREARTWLETLAGKDSVQIGMGGVTAALRRRWGLNGLLGSTAEKNRSDHRHHAVDAVVIALTTSAAIKRMSELAARGRRPEDAGLEPPWEHFRDDVRRRIEAILVSFRALRRVRGGLHQETNYGILGLRDDKGQELFAVRKDLASLTGAELSRIADPRVRELVSAHFQKHGADLAAANPEKSAPWKAALAAPLPAMPNRRGAPVPIRRVRLHKPLGNVFRLKDAEGRDYRAVDSGSNHHIVAYEILSGPNKGKWEGRVVSTFEAVRRIRAGQPVIQRDFGPDRRFVMSLSINEMVAANQDDRREHWRVQKIDASAGSVTFRTHTAATLADNSARRIKSPDALRRAQAVKVTVDPIGREGPAHD